MTDGITIDATLRPGVTWRGRTADGSFVVLKLLPDDCLRDGRLHPAIALRLTRLREAPVAGLAAIVGVERLDVGACVVSEFIDGQPLDSLSAADRRDHLPAAGRLVASLHRFGLVHGAIGPGNFVVDTAGQLRLIDPSPLLYDDPAVDLADLARMGFDEAQTATVPTPPRRINASSLAAAAILSVVAIAGAAGWAWHVAGRP